MTVYTPKTKNLSYTYKTRSFAGEVVLDKESNKKKIAIQAPYWYQNEINKFNVGDHVTINVTNKRPKRTEQQNRYIWGVYYPEIAKETGENDLDYLHECFKRKFLKKGTKVILGEEITIYGSTTELSVGEFKEFILNIQTLTGIEAPPTENFNLAPLKN